MKTILRRWSGVAILLGAFMVAGCGGSDAAAPESHNVKVQQESATNAPAHAAASSAQQNDNKEVINLSQMNLKITVGDKVMTARLEDNPTTRAFVDKLPTTLHMENLYGREMCYRYGKGGLTESATRSDRYEVGDIVYWPPRGSFVILYKQNGEEFERVQLGHIDGDVSMFEGNGDMDVKFEQVKK